MTLGALGSADYREFREEKPEFHSIQFDGRKVYLCGFQHGVGVLTPGKGPIEATRRLFARETPYVMIEGINTQRKAKRHLKCAEFLNGEDVEKHFYTVLKTPDVRRSLQNLLGVSPTKFLNVLRVMTTIVSPFFYLNTRAKGNRNYVYRGLAPLTLHEVSNRIQSEATTAFDSSAHVLDRMDYFVGTFRSFLMADAVLQRHAALPREIPFAFFKGNGHSPEVEAFLTNPELFKTFKKNLPPVLNKIVDRVRQLNDKTIKAYLAEDAPHSGIRMSQHAAAVLREEK